MLTFADDEGDARCFVDERECGSRGLSPRATPLLKIDRSTGCFFGRKRSMAGVGITRRKGLGESYIGDIGEF